MNETSREWQEQQDALRDPRPDGGRGDRYRAVYHALARAPRSEPPPDFSQGVLARLAEWEREDRIERRWLGLLGALLGIAVAIYSAPMVFAALDVGVPAGIAGFSLLRSPLLWATLAAGAAAGALDRFAEARTRHSRSH